MAEITGRLDRYTVKAGSTSVQLPVYFKTTSDTPDVDVTDTGVHTTTAYYYRAGAAAAVAITVNAGSDAWSDGALTNMYTKHVTLAGFYTFGIPDAALADGVPWVIIQLKTDASGAIGWYGCMIHLVDYDPYDGVRLGLTALPNAIPGAANGMLTSNGTVVNQTVDLTAGQSINVGSMGANVVTATSIADGAITNAKVADDVDVNVKTMSANVVTATAIESNAFTTAKFANDFLTDAKVAADVTILGVTGTIGSFASGALAQMGTVFANGLDAVIPTVPTTGSINQLIKDNIDAEISAIDVSGFVAAPTVEETRAEMDSNSTQLAAIRAKCNLFGSGIAQGISPMDSADRFRITIGDDYSATDSRALSWTEDGGWPTLAGTVTLEINDVGSYACTYSGTVGSQVITCALTAAQTAPMSVGTFDFNLLYVTTSGGRKISLVADGTCVIIKQVKYVAP